MCVCAYIFFNYEILMLLVCVTVFVTSTITTFASGLPNMSWKAAKCCPYTDMSFAVTTRSSSRCPLSRRFIIDFCRLF